MFVMVLLHCTYVFDSNLSFKISKNIYRYIKYENIKATRRELNSDDKFLQRKPRRGPPNRKPVNFNFVNTIGWQSSALHV